MANAGAQHNVVTTVPPLRPVFDQPDPEYDDKRVAWAWRRWKGQNEALRAQDRQIEESIRMLAGQQWLAWSPLSGRYLDVSEWFTDDEKKWRQRPVLNRLLPWFMLTHSRLTENPPIVTHLPGPDRSDADVAETMDTIYKALWREVGMIDVNDRMHMWLTSAGRAHLQTLIDVSRGKLIARRGVAPVPVFDGLGQPVMNERTGGQHTVDAEVPLGKNYQPQAIIQGGVLTPTGEDPVYDREGSLEPWVLSPLQVRGQWGAHIPWHLKRWHEVLTYEPVEDIYEKYGITVEPDLRGAALGVDEGGYLERSLFGPGHYGAASKRSGSEASNFNAVEGYAKVLTHWNAPPSNAGPDDVFADQLETPENPGGRLLICTRDKTLIDMPRPAHFRWTSPIRTFEFVRLPGRQGGSSPQEAMNPLQRSYNRSWGQINEHTNLVTNPVGVYDRQSGLKDGAWTNETGLKLGVLMRPGVKPLDYLNPPALGQDVWKRQQMLLAELEYYGMLEGARGNVPSEDPSGELVRELRANSDRPYGSPARRNAEEYARFIQDWWAWVPVVWPQGRILQYAGDDNVARTLMVYPELFKPGACDVIADVESMVPEGAAGREARADRLYQAGLLGVPGSPAAIKRYFDLGQAPHIGRLAKIGGIDQTMAEHENAAMLQGQPGELVAMFPWYDDLIHLMVHESVMKAPGFLKLEPEVQAAFSIHWERHYARAQAAAVQEAQAQAALAAAGAPLGKPQGKTAQDGGRGLKSGSQPRRITAGPHATSPAQAGSANVEAA